VVEAKLSALSIQTFPRPDTETDIRVLETSKRKAWIGALDTN
jgi:hypothetical protein